MTSHENTSSLVTNADFETEFELDTTSGSTLTIHHEGESNREKITADCIRNSNFRANLISVQYGTYKPESAALLVFEFLFGFKNSKRDRFTSVIITVEFEETLNASFGTPPDRNPKSFRRSIQ